MDNVSKFVSSLSPDDRRRIVDAVEKIRTGKIAGLDIKKLQGYKDIFRIRVGKYRIICKHIKKYGFIIVWVGIRGDTTYNL